MHKEVICGEITGHVVIDKFKLQRKWTSSHLERSKLKEQHWTVNTITGIL